MASSSLPAMAVLAAPQAQIAQPVPTARATRRPRQPRLAAPGVISALPRVAVTEVPAAAPTPRAVRPQTAREARCRLQSRLGALAAANPARKERAGSAVTQPRRVRPTRRPGTRQHRARAQREAQAEERTGSPRRQRRCEQQGDGRRLRRRHVFGERVRRKWRLRRRRRLRPRCDRR